MARYAIEVPPGDETQERPNTANLRMLFINHRSFAGGVENEIGIVVSDFASEKPAAPPHVPPIAVSFTGGFRTTAPAPAASAPIRQMSPRQVTKLRQCSVLRSISCRTTLRSRIGAASYNVVENRGIS